MGTLELRLPEAPSPAYVTRLCAGLRREVAAGQISHVVCDAARLPGDVPSVEVLARLALTARRSGAGLSVVGVSAQLRSLLELVGLDTVLVPGSTHELQANPWSSPDPLRTVSDAPPVLSSSKEPP